MMPILAFVLSPVGRWLAAIGLAAALVAGAYGLGHHKGTVASDARWQAAMAVEQTRQANVRAKALDAAVTRELDRAKQNAALQDQIDGYETELAARPADPRCALGRVDVDRLRQLQGETAR